jgi:hypothetical protein
MTSGNIPTPAGNIQMTPGNIPSHQHASQSEISQSITNEELEVIQHQLGSRQSK